MVNNLANCLCKQLPDGHLESQVPLPAPAVAANLCGTRAANCCECPNADQAAYLFCRTHLLVAGWCAQSVPQLGTLAPDSMAALAIPVLQKHGKHGKPYFRKKAGGSKGWQKPVLEQNPKSTAVRAAM